MRIAVALTIRKRNQKRIFGIDTELSRDQLVEDLVMRIMGPPESEAVVLVPSLTGDMHSPHYGKWGIDEPHPHPDLPIADH